MILCKCTATFCYAVGKGHLDYRISKIHLQRSIYSFIIFNVKSLSLMQNTKYCLIFVFKLVHFAYKTNTIKGMF